MVQHVSPSPGDSPREQDRARGLLPDQLSVIDTEKATDKM